MPLLVFVVMMIVAALLVPFTMRAQISSPYQDRLASAADTNAFQMESFARAAWHLARSGAQGPLDRAAMILPAGFADDPAMPLQARVDGGYLYVWRANSTAYGAGADQVFPDGDETIDVGISSGGVLTFRSGASVPRPSFLPSTSLIVRLRV